jgi:hypothetical protein
MFVKVDSVDSFISWLFGVAIFNDHAQVGVLFDAVFQRLEECLS